ncbi:MAG: FAD:protein FMN transferase [Rhodobiaceae bacterium]|nr:FAD:protein FMN transferase [Rhodobiaceae bacterium]
MLAGTAATLATPRPASSAAPLVRWQGTAMGARTSLAIAGRTREESHRLVELAVAEIERMEGLFSLYRGDSAIARLNRHGRLATPPADFVALLETCDRVHALTGGMFDPTVQPIWRLLAQRQGTPDSGEMEDARTLVDWRQLSFDKHEVAFARSGMALTLNGIAQGYATDRVADLLRGAGLGNVMVSVGEIACLGEPEPGKPWRIGVALREDAPADDEIELRDMAIATSAPLGTTFDRARSVGHIVAPLARSSYPEWERISVIHRSAALADGLSTGFCLMPAEQIATAATRAGATVRLKTARQPA